MPQLITSGFDPGDDEKVIAILDKWDTGPLGDQLFTVLAGIIPQPIVEVVVFRCTQRLETLLLPRPAGDPLWPGMVHTPGAALRRADFYRPDNDPMRGVFERIEREIGAPFLAKPEFVTVYPHVSERGPEVSQIFIAQIKEAPRLDSEWYPVDDLPKRPDFIKSQLPFVQMATDYFLLLNQ